MEKKIFKKIIAIIGVIGFLSPTLSLAAATEFFSDTLINDANLQAYWRLEANGTSTVGIIGNLTVNNSPSFVAGLFNNGVDLEKGSSQTLSVAHDLNADGGSDFTYACWAKTENNDTATQVILYYDFGGDKADGYIYINPGANTAEFDYTNNADHAINVAHDPTTTDFYHYAIRKSGVNLRAYINGVQVGTDVDTTGTPSGGAREDRFTIGSFNRPGFNTDFFDGIVDDCVAFNRALTDAEVDRIANGAAAPAGGGGCTRKLKGTGITRC